MINKIKESYLAELEAIKENMDQAFHLIEVNEELEVVDITQRACNGEMVQNVNRGNVSVTIDAYLEAIRGKTAASGLSAGPD